MGLSLLNDLMILDRLFVEDLSLSRSDRSGTRSCDGLWFHAQDIKKFPVLSNRRMASFVPFSEFIEYQSMAEGPHGNRTWELFSFGSL